ncbi:MAG: type II toxin-antitoxin system HicB family antitoxin [Blastocatellales bacterium]
MLYKIPLVFSPQPEGGFTVTSPLLPELITEGDSFDEAFANVQDALEAVVEAYQDSGKELPSNTRLNDADGAIWLETVVAAA